MTYPPHAQGFSVSVPEWLAAETEALPVVMADPSERMRTLNRLALRNIGEGTGGPFSAMVIDTATSEIVSVGVNLVLGSGLSSAHAEVVALSLAQARTGEWNLGESAGRSLVVNAQPCAMCLGALVWSGVEHLQCSVSGADVEAITGFDEGPVAADWIEQLRRRGISVELGLESDTSAEVLQAFHDLVSSGEATLYNGRAQG